MFLTIIINHQDLLKKTNKMTGLLVESEAKCDNLKGVVMRYKHFNDIKPNHRIDFIMLYFAACRSLRELEAAIRRINNGHLTCRQAWLLRRIQRKITQMVALWKNEEN